MAKPIFIVKVNHKFPTGRISYLELRIKAHLKDEYHVIVAACQADPKEPEFIVLNADGIPESTIEEIKALVNPIIPAPATKPATGFNTDRFE